MVGKKTNLFLLGVQKCGTTTLADLLSSHDEVFVPSIKECYFFPLAENFSKGTDWYEREFFRTEAAQEAKWRVDATAFNLNSRKGIERIADYAPDDARFVVTLRDPVSRAVSAYKHQLRTGHETLSFEDALKAEDQRIEKAQGGRWWRHAYRKVGHYGSYLEDAFEILGRERFLIFRMDQLSNREVVTEQLSDFLGLSVPFSSVPAGPQSNAASMPRSRLLRNMVTSNNPLKSVVKALVPRETRTKVGMALLNMNSKRAPDIRIADETRAMLAASFREDQARLASMGIQSHIS